MSKAVSKAASSTTRSKPMARTKAPTNIKRPAKRLAQDISARALAALPKEQRSAILRQAAAEAVADYETDAELTIFTTSLEGEDFVDY